MHVRVRVRVLHDYPAVCAQANKQGEGRDVQRGGAEYSEAGREVVEAPEARLARACCGGLPACAQ